MVVDTSVLFDALVPGPHTATARALLDSAGEVAAPDLLMSEIAGALTRAVRARKLTRREAEEVFVRARQISPELIATRSLLARAFDLSLELAHPTADCVFLSHAERDGDKLVTSDLRFARKVAASRYARFVVALPDWAPEPSR